MQTPWGPSQHITRYGRGIKFVSTAGHGGFFVPGGLLPDMPPTLRRMGQSMATLEISEVGRWYEEDCEASAVILSFPLMFENMEVGKAATTFRNWYWKEYEYLSGRVLNPGESLSKDRQHPTDGEYLHHPQDYASGPSRDEVDPESEAIAEAHAERRREFGG